jgi:ribose transport system permease protein
MDAEVAPTMTREKKNLLRSDAAQKIGAFAALIILFLGFSVSSPYFLTGDNVVGILLATAVNGILALGVTFVIITGGIDLSVGAVMAFSAVMTAVFITEWGLPLPIGILGGILVGGAAGFINGTVISRMKIPPFIATLGMLYATKGLSLVASGLKPIYFNDTPIFRKLAMDSYLGSIIPGVNVPNAVFVMFGAAIIAWLILSKTVLGRYTFAIGSNEEATRLSGVNVAFWKTSVYMLCGLFAGLGGVLMAARLNSAQPALAGAGYELDAIAAVVIGGTSLSGGEGSILGTIIGAFIMSVLTNGLRINSVPQEYQMVITGVIVVLAVYLDILRRRR